MYSFTLERADYLAMNFQTHDVWILYRLNRQSCLIIGVFDSRDAAFAYTEKNGPVDQSGWVEPRPGQRHWQYETDMFTYYLERHQVRRGSGVVQDTILQLSTAHS